MNYLNITYKKIWKIFQSYYNYISHISLFIIAYILIYIYILEYTKNTQTAFVIHNAINLKIKQCIIQII